MSYAFGVTVHMGHADAVDATRAALAEQGFGVLSARRRLEAALERLV